MVGNTAQRLEGSNGTASSDMPLEKIVGLSFISGDKVLKETIAESLGQENNIHYSTLPYLATDNLNELSEVYVTDLVSLTTEGYGAVLEKIKQIRAIDVESRVVLLATDRQQNLRGFESFLEASQRGLVGIMTRPDPSKSTEGEYAMDIKKLSDMIPGYIKELDTNGRFGNVEVVKIGGSMFDPPTYKAHPEAIHDLLATVVDVHKMHDLILFVGGGPLLEMPPEFRDSYHLSDARTIEASRALITQQTLNVVDILEQIRPGITAYIPPEFVMPLLRDGLLTREFLGNRIPLISYLPDETQTLGIPPIPPNGSDVAVVRFADYIGARKIIFAKYTDGIWEYDPNLTPEQRKELGYGETNNFFPFIRAGDITRKTSRMGLSNKGEFTRDHVIEDAAIGPLKESETIYALQVVNGAKPQEFVKAMEGKKAGSYIIPR